MSVVVLVTGIALAALAAGLPDSDLRDGLAFVGVGFVLASSLMREERS